MNMYINAQHDACERLVLLVINLCICKFSRGNTPETRGTAFVVYEDIFDAKNACDHLSGFNVCNRYLVVLYYQVIYFAILYLSSAVTHYSESYTNNIYICAFKGKVL